MIARAATVALWLALPGVCLAAQITGEPARWSPGSAPCNGDCPLDWALANMVESGIIPRAVANKVLAGEVEPTVALIRDGEVVQGMSWAVNGSPFFGARAYQTDSGGNTLVADSYIVSYGGRIWEVMKVRLCDNWTSRSRPAPESAAPNWAAPVAKHNAGISVGLPGAPGASHHTVRVPGESPPSTPSPIPLPGAVWAFLSALAALFGTGLLRRGERK